MNNALRTLGTPELIRGELNPVVRGYFAHTTYPERLINKKTPWCAAWVSTCLEESGARSARTAKARNYLLWGFACAFRFGCVMVFKRGVGEQGHVCFGLELAAGVYLTIDGNHHNRVGFAEHSADDLLGIRWPKANQLPPGITMPPIASV